MVFLMKERIATTKMKGQKMKITKRVIKVINNLIEKKASEYYDEPQPFEDGRSYQLPLKTCIEHAIDDFGNNVKQWMFEEGYELTDEECDEIDRYAMHNVNWKSIKENA